MEIGAPVGTAATDEALEFARAAARIASDNKAECICVLDLRGLSTLTDFFVLGTGTSDRQMRAVLDLVDRHARSVGRRCYSREGINDATWMLSDYVDVVVHLFDGEHRAYYDLDGLWGDAPRVEWGAPSNGTPDEPRASARADSRDS